MHRFQERLSTDKEYLLQIARDVAKVAVGIEKGQVLLLKPLFSCPKKAKSKAYLPTAINLFEVMELPWTWRVLSWNVAVVKSIWYRPGPSLAEAQRGFLPRFRLSLPMSEFLRKLQNIRQGWHF